MARISVEEAAKRLQAGQVVAIPTETVYGLAASLSCPAAIEQIFQLKGRPRINPLIVHVADLETARALSAGWPQEAEALSVLWPGPLTLLVEADKARVPESVRAGLPTVGLRIPLHPLCSELLKRTGPLVAPSANLSGRPSASLASHVEEDFGVHFPVLDGGPCQAGVESTIITTAPLVQIARLGALSSQEIFQRTGLQIVPLRQESEQQMRPLCPGQLLQHYSPRARLLRFSRADAGPSSASPAHLLGFSDRHYGTLTVWSLGRSDQPLEVAANLYATLRRLDQVGIQEAWIDDRVEEEGLWATIRERIWRASEGSV